MGDFLNWELTNRMHNLGYDGKTLMYIDDEEDIINDDSAELIGAKPAILTSAAFRWFREKYNLIFQINYLFNGNYQVVIHKNTHEYMNLIQSHPHSCVDEVPDNYSYEEAELACLDKLIEIFNNDN